MPNHVHLVAVPQTAGSLAQFMRTVNRNYAVQINRRMGWSGHLWQERFHSFVMDEIYLYSAVRYIELNPVRAKLCDRPIYSVTMTQMLMCSRCWIGWVTGGITCYRTSLAVWLEV